VSLLYPLAVANLLAAAMNLAAELGAPTVTADIVKEA
jgi:type II secretory pathway predicted ATPase ExeA